MLVKVLEPLNTYNGRYARGDTVDLNTRVAQALIMQGRAEEVVISAPKRETLDKKMGTDIQTEESAAEKAERIKAQVRARQTTTAATNRPHPATHRPPRTS